MLTLQDVSKKLRMPKSVILRLIENGKLTATQLNGDYAFSEDQFYTTTEQDAEIEAFLEKMWSKAKTSSPSKL